jgi:polyribonucleotide nucleotidyltransferase
MEGVLKSGDEIEVKLIEVDKKTGKFRLSRKALLPRPEGMPEESARPPRGPRSEGPRGPRREGGPRHEGGRRDHGPRDHQPRSHEGRPESNGAPEAGTTE